MFFQCTCRHDDFGHNMTATSFSGTPSQAIPLLTGDCYQNANHFYSCNIQEFIWFLESQSKTHKPSSSCSYNTSKSLIGACLTLCSLYNSDNRVIRVLAYEVCFYTYCNLTCPDFNREH